MAIQWSDFALRSLEEIIIRYEFEAGRLVADSIQNRIWQQVEKMDGFPMSVPVSELFPGTRKLVIRNLPYVAFIRLVDGEVWEVVDVVHTARKLPEAE
ncbi:MAG: type II toxin-antitoxin system RelE/ParE family toxin [Candidatus Dechloromonas phosphoritropha]|jgi:plasmid stabilization system protein ParE